MAPIQPNHKRYTTLVRALKSSNITQKEFDYCVENGVALSLFKAGGAPSPEEVPTPSPALLAPSPEEVPMPSPALLAPQAPIKKRKRFTEPFHGGVALMSLQETFDSLADQVLQDVEEGIRRDVINNEIQEEAKKGWWGISLLGR